MSVKKTVEKNEAFESKMALGKRNYILILIGFAVVVLGFALMTGGGSDNPAMEFDYGMFSFRRITLSVILVLSGFVGVAYGIMSKGGRNPEKK